MPNDNIRKKEYEIDIWGILRVERGIRKDVENEGQSNPSVIGALETVISKLKIYSRLKE